MQEPPRHVTGYRLTLWVSMTAEEVQAYRTEHALAPEESLRRHLAQRLETQLAGEGTLMGWWHDTRVR